MHYIRGYIVRLSEYKGDSPGVELTSEYKLVRDKPAVDHVFIETDYFGGIGEQFAYLFVNGVKKRPKHTSLPINKCLKEFGVVSNPGMDEFDTLNLSKWRTNEELFGVNHDH